MGQIWVRWLGLGEVDEDFSNVQKTWGFPHKTRTQHVSGLVSWKGGLRAVFGDVLITCCYNLKVNFTIWVTPFTSLLGFKPRACRGYSSLFVT